MSETKTETTEEVKRTCSNCACCIVQQNAQNPMEKQSFCQRDTPMFTRIRVERPRMRDGQPVIDRTGKPILEMGEEGIYLYKPTLPTLVCFDGWRPLGTLPGDDPVRTSYLSNVQPLLAAFRRLAEDVQTESIMPFFPRIKSKVTSGEAGIAVGCEQG
jgi:hypothetical protein